MEHNIFKKIAFKIRDDRKLKSILIDLIIVVIVLISIDDDINVLEASIILFILIACGYYFKVTTNQRFNIFRVFLVIIGVILLTIVTVILLSWIAYMLIV